ncbi:protein kinase domain-containing protein [Microsporum canis CBS 113480]|uniref:Protein kinase domain-containing protein n=1 Tax=Arthroderma otae (strain ATCC MYA-4605 / CBS 113480) TaxID=554155 RepID=C5FXG6_ARTOC|nr:protein kinase domain-containing protein [Microsporum canis CBS 113480]EEQ35006.1 protein kinase domain-containing protein [Microsporum canis CBS 113480]
MSLIKQPPRLARYPFLSLGAIGLVYKIDEEIVLKIHEEIGVMHSHGRLRCLTSSKNIIRVLWLSRAFYVFQRATSSLFLEVVRVGHSYRGRVETVTAQEPIELVKQWSMELSHAAAWLENLGYVHADIRPPNLLLDGDDRLKLIDFDCAAKIGSPSDGSAPPWARILGVEAVDDAGSFGLYGARTEQFAIGSVIYLMTRGYEPYENEDPGLNIVDLFRRMEFPSLGNDPLDRIIDRCWKGQFEYLKDLAEETSTLSGGNHPKSLSSLTERYRLERQKKCQTLVNQGLLEWEV